MGYAVLVVVLMVFCPSGLLGLLERLIKPAAAADRAAARSDAAAQREGAR